MFSGGEKDFLNDDITKLSERLNKIGMKKVSLIKDDKADHDQDICKVDEELNSLN